MSSAVSLRLNRIAAPVSNLGFGRRIAVWVQGCRIGCPGCISPHTWDAGEGETVAVRDIIEMIGHLEERRGPFDGLTVTGGEPLEQAESVGALLAALREVGWLGDGARDALIYSGFPRSVIERDAAALLLLADAIIAGPFVGRLAGDAIRGSSNQEVMQLTRLGATRYRDFAREAPLEGVLAGNTLYLSGIPQRASWLAFDEALRQAGLARQLDRQ